MTETAKSKSREDKIYRKLRKHLDQFPVGMPETKSGVELSLLKKIFTPEEALIATKLSIFPKTKHDLYLRFRRKYSEDEFGEMLETMARKGGIFRYRRGEETYYSNAFLAVGMFEYQLNRMTREFADEFDQYIEEGFADEVITSKPPQLRVIPIEETIEKENAIKTYDYLEDLIRGERGKISVAECICRKKKDIQGEPCDHIRETCFQFGGAAEFYIENDLARQVSKDEAVEIMKQAKEEGLVLEPGNTKHPYAICACCSCCCEILTNLQKLNKPSEFVHSNYHAHYQESECIGCGKCEDRCPMSALVLVESEETKTGKIATFDIDRCIGCGLCVYSCPTDALKMVKKDENLQQLPPKNTKELYMKIGMEKNASK